MGQRDEDEISLQRRRREPVDDVTTWKGLTKWAREQVDFAGILSPGRKALPSSPWDDHVDYHGNIREHLADCQYCRDLCRLADFPEEDPNYGKQNVVVTREEYYKAKKHFKDGLNKFVEERKAEAGVSEELAIKEFWIKFGMLLRKTTKARREHEKTTA